MSSGPTLWLSGHQGRAGGGDFLVVAVGLRIGCNRGRSLWASGFGRCVLLSIAGAAYFYGLRHANPLLVVGLPFAATCQWRVMGTAAQQVWRNTSAAWR